MRLRPILRTPLGRAGVPDRERAFDALVAETEREVTLGRLPIPELRIVLADALLRVPLEQMAWPGFEPQTAEIFRGLASGQPVVSRCRLATIHVAGGPAAQAATIVEARMEAGLLAGYRLAVRPAVGTGPARWQVREGVEVTSLEPAFRRQLDPSAPQPDQPWPAGPRPALHCASLPLPIPPPPRPQMLAQVLVQDVLREVLATPEDRLEAFIFRDRTVERWFLRRGLPFSVHEVLRNLAGADARAIVLVQPTIVEAADGVRHAVLFHAEVAHTRGGMIVPLDVGPDGALRPLGARPFGGGLAGKDAWIGVPPRKKLDVRPADGGPEN